MARLIGLGRAESDELPREITRIPSETGDSGWLIRFFDSAFFCEWIAISYLYKHDHQGVRDYLCNRMYSLPHSGIESYLFQICYMLVHKSSPSLDKFVIDMCSKSLRIALKVHWFLMAEAEDSEDSEGISRVQEKCQIAATLMGDWLPLIRPQSSPASPGSKNRVLNRLFSSKQRLLSLTSSPPLQKNQALASPPPSNVNTGATAQEENKIGAADESEISLKVLKKLMPGSKVRDALFKRFTDKEDEEADRAKETSKESEQESFFRRLLRDSKEEEERTVRNEELASSDGFFKRLFRDKSDAEEKSGVKSGEEDEKDSFFRRLFREKNEDREKRDGQDKADDDEKGNASCDEEEGSNFLSFRRLFRVHPEDEKSLSTALENCSLNTPESSPGTESFFRRLFRDQDRSVEDSELFSLKRHKEKRPGSPKRSDKSSAKPPLPNNVTSQIRKGTYHASLDFVQSLCDTSYALVDLPMEDRRNSLHESLAEINSHLTVSQSSGGVCFPMGKGLYRVVHIPEDEAVLLNSREKAPYLICVEVLRGENQNLTSENKDSSSHKLSRGGIPLANGDVHLQRPPPWAFPLWNQQDVHRNSTDQMLRSASQAIDQAMTNLWETKVKFVHVSLSVNQQSHDVQGYLENNKPGSTLENPTITDLNKDSESNMTKDGYKLGDTGIVDQGVEEWITVTLTAVPGLNMEDVEDQEIAGRKDHRRVPSTIAMAEVKAAAAKGEAPPGLPVKRGIQDSLNTRSEAISISRPKATDALAGELWEVKKERIRKASIYGKSADWDLRSVIVKSGDDCRQEHLAVQLISHFYDIFQEAGLPLWLRPYEVLVTSSYTALIETIPDTASVHAIKSRHPNITSLREFFAEKYEENSPSFKFAQRNFVESMAGYSILCYLLQVKDRHNGNLLMDEEGHIIHIDFGFMLSNSPGGVNFESAPFKLTRELLEVMDSDADGGPSEFFDYFKVLCIQGFLTCRKHAERIILLVEMLQDSGFPCFKGGPKTIQYLRKRFHLSLTEEQCVSLVLSLISSSLDAWRTRQYDYYQRVLNGIL
ncbi:hypothetical protein SUGI_0742710 [Cryptomeria japonica]|uniref:phosphatidylinositol 4-kinase beta 2 n=1 Tax=Cryptomeria japonica TaxID=3369 RepID=UPI002414C7DD|nr:phosphatidylinositol 4-kinase beta 2 [Cryptomeria japonica]GLJ36817.1 hypothetical protein SUGI_0742710 [Cryptomeria japonica]